MHRKIFCVGWNYRDHVIETDAELPEAPIVFTKPHTALARHGQPILLPDLGRMDYEAEMAIIIGKGGRNIPEEEALSHVEGLAAFNDVTARDLQAKARRTGAPWTLAKGMDTFAPMSEPVPFRAIHDLYDLDIECRVNGRVRQRGNTRNMIFPVEKLIAYISLFNTLEPGDIIATGTPEGIGPIVPGDFVEVEVFSVGSVGNPVRAIQSQNRLVRA